MNIDKENLLKVLRAGPYEGKRSHELADAMQADVKGRHRLRTLLAELIDDNVIEKAGGGRYRLAGLAPPPAPAGDGAGALQKGWVTGQLRVHPSGFGFL